MKKLFGGIKWAFSRYQVGDCYGTRVDAWTIKEANSWLSCCSGFAIISDKYSGEVVAARFMEEIGEE